MVILTDPGQLEEHFTSISVCTFKCNFNVKLNDICRDSRHTTLYRPVTGECTCTRVVSDIGERHA